MGMRTRQCITARGQLVGDQGDLMTGVQTRAKVPKQQQKEQAQKPNDDARPCRHEADGADTKESQAISKVIERIQDAYDRDDPPPDKVLAVLERLETEYMEARGDSWYLRSEIVWHKPNPMPESVTDRPTSSHEKLFLFAKSGSPSLAA